MFCDFRATLDHITTPELVAFCQTMLAVYELHKEKSKNP